MRISFLAATMFVAASVAFAQSDRGSITGTTVDPTGAAVTNAQVEASNMATGAVYKVETTATGNYTLANFKFSDDGSGGALITEVSANSSTLAVSSGTSEVQHQAPNQEPCTRTMARLEGAGEEASVPAHAASITPAVPVTN